MEGEAAEDQEEADCGVVRAEADDAATEDRQPSLLRG